MLKELFGLTISEGAIANSFRRMTAPVIASDETTTRVNGVTHWRWAFHSDQAVLHEIVPSRGRAVAEKVLGDVRPEVWVPDRYAGRQELGKAHQVCLAHVLRDVQYTIDCVETDDAMKNQEHAAAQFYA